MTQETKEPASMTPLDEFYSILRPKKTIADETMKFETIMKIFRMVEGLATKEEKLSELEDHKYHAFHPYNGLPPLVEFPAHVHSKTTMAYIGALSHLQFEDVPEAMYPATLYYPLLTAEQRETLNDEDKEDIFREEEAYHRYVQLLEQAKESNTEDETHVFFLRMVNLTSAHITPLDINSKTIAYHLGLLSLKDE